MYKKVCLRLHGVPYTVTRTAHISDPAAESQSLALPSLPTLSNRRESPDHEQSNTCMYTHTHTHTHDHVVSILSSAHVKEAELSSRTRYGTRGTARVRLGKHGMHAWVHVCHNAHLAVVCSDVIQETVALHVPDQHTTLLTTYR